MARLRNTFLGKRVLVAAGVAMLAAVAAGVAPSFSARFRAAKKESPSSARTVTERNTSGRVERNDPARDSRLALIEARLAGLGEQVGETARAVAKANAETAAREAEPQREEPRGLEAPEVRARFERMFDGEPADAVWAPSERRLLSDFFSGADATGAQVKSLECRTDMCRVEATFDSERSRSAFVEHMGQPPFDKGTFGTLEPDMKGVVLFTGREGRPLPTFSADDG